MELRFLIADPSSASPPCPLPLPVQMNPVNHECAEWHQSRQPSVALWTVAPQAPLSLGFSRQGYWSGLPCPPPGGLPDPGTEPACLTFHALAGGFFTPSPTWELFAIYCHYIKATTIHNNHSCLKFYFCNFSMVAICLLCILQSFCFHMLGINL